MATSVVAVDADAAGVRVPATSVELEELEELHAVGTNTDTAARSMGTILCDEMLRWRR